MREEDQNPGKDGQEKLIRLSKMTEILSSSRTMLLKQRLTQPQTSTMSMEECLERLENLDNTN